MATVYEFNYTGSEQSVTLKPGKYKLECFGARGFAFSGTPSSKGGYTYGELTLKKETTLYIYVGGVGLDHRKDVFAYNGGGLSRGQGGGGATDIRLVGGEWNNKEGLLSRIIVAGGAGGSYSDTPGGLGGGFEGGNGRGSSEGYLNYYTPGATQYAGGRGYKDCFSGVFGCGAGAVLGLSDSDYAYNGGGGGWFGGASNGTTSSGSGGSGYALTKDSYKPKGYTPTSEYWLENTGSVAGGNTTKIEGYCKIELLQSLPFLTVSSYNSTQATFKADHTDPTLLTKIEYFIDDVLKETITTDLTSEKTINYTLEDNALHTLKIVVTDSANAIAEKVVSISKNIMPLGDNASLQDIASKVSEIKEGLINGKNSIINVLALKNIESSLNNSLVELSEKVKESFDSSDTSVNALQNRITELTNQLSQRAKFATGTFSVTDNKFPITIPTNLNFVPKMVIVRFMTVKDKNGLMINSDTFGNLSSPQYGYATVNGVKKIVFDFHFENISESSFTIAGGSNDSVVDFPITVANSTLRWYVFDVDIV
ncbi:glycine rich domain-containing protein [Clostridioides difficile]|nr:glycine rich domain-containing protein [Clostridioides difficile]